MNNKITTFKIILNSLDTNSWTGVKYNATYPIDLRNVILIDKNLDYEYSMTYTFLSKAEAGLSSANIYQIGITLGNGAINSSILQPNQSSGGGLTTDILNVIYDQTSGVLKSHFQNSVSDSPPTYVRNLRNLNTINIKVCDNSYTMYSGSADYLCVLHFHKIVSPDI